MNGFVYATDLVVSETGLPGISRYNPSTGSREGVNSTDFLYPTGLDLVQASTTTPTARLINISTRGKVLTGDDILIGGFVTGGTGSKRVLVKAWGPRLGALGVPGTLADPFLDIVDQSNGQVIASNNDWQSAPFCAGSFTCESTTQLVGNPTFDPCFPIGEVPPANCGKKAILIVTLSPSAAGYTARVSGVGGGTGVGLVEVTELQ